MASMTNEIVTEVTGSMKSVQQAVHIRHDRWIRPWKENSFLVPLPCRRTNTVVSDFLPLTPFRSRSARPLTTPCHVMQRHSNVSVARLFDWSEQDKDEPLSVSRLYREIAGGVGTSVPRNLPEKVRPRVPPNGAGTVTAVGGVWPGGSSPRVNPGRMFLRDKGMLTKGEREIIQGIYKNRGDLRKYPLNNKSDFFVRSHHDAWLVGKPGLPSNKPSTEIPRESPRGSLMEVTAPANQSAESSRPALGDGSGSRDERHGQARTTCIVCIREQQLLEQLQMQKHQQRQKPHKSQPPALPQGSVLRPIHVNDTTFKPRGEEGPLAPPTSPSPTSRPKEHHGKSSSVNHRASPPSPRSKLRSKRQKEAPVSPEPKTNGHVASIPPWEEHGDTGSDSEGSQDSEGSRRKLHVKVYLPMVAAEATDEDLRTCVLEGRPAIARERHLSYTDLRKERGEAEGDGEGTGGEGLREIEHVKKEGTKDEERSKPRLPHSTSSKSGENAGQFVGGDSDSESSRVSSRRVPLHTHPVTILKADTGEESRQLD